MFESIKNMSIFKDIEKADIKLLYDEGKVTTRTGKLIYSIGKGDCYEYKFKGRKIVVLCGPDYPRISQEDRRLINVKNGDLTASPLGFEDWIGKERYKDIGVDDASDIIVGSVFHRLATSFKAKTNNSIMMYILAAAAGAGIFFLVNNFMAG